MNLVNWVLVQQLSTCYTDPNCSTYLHLAELDIALRGPGIPLRSLFFIEISTSTILVPPASTIFRSTVDVRLFVIIRVLSCEILPWRRATTVSDRPLIAIWRCHSKTVFISQTIHFDVTVLSKAIFIFVCPQLYSKKPRCFHKHVDHFVTEPKITFLNIPKASFVVSPISVEIDPHKRTCASLQDCPTSAVRFLVAEHWNPTNAFQMNLLQTVWVVTRQFQGQATLRCIK